MAFATIQITQGGNVGGAGRSIIGCDRTTAITLTDAGGAGATNWLWEVVSFPATDASPPTIVNSTTQVGTITPAPSITDGIYVIRLTRTDPIDGVSTDVRFFAVQDDDLLSLPSAGMNRTMSNVGGSVNAQQAGWFGSTLGGTNVFMDAFLRLRKRREGRFYGKNTPITHSSSSPSGHTFLFTDTTKQTITMTGSGVYTADLDPTSFEAGNVFRFRVIYNSGAGNFILRDNGTTVRLTLSAPPASTVTYEIEATFDGTNWLLSDFMLLDVHSIRTFHEFLGVAGVQSNSTNTFARIGTLRVDPSLFPVSQQITWEATFDTTDSGNAAEVQLYNVTDIAVVSGSTFSTTSTTASLQSAVVTLPGSQKDYEIQLRLTTTDVTKRATCTRARLVIRWG